MIASEHVATLGSRSAISGWAAISPSRKSSRFARHRVHRHPDYPASLGLDLTLALVGACSLPPGSPPRMLASRFHAVSRPRLSYTPPSVSTTSVVNGSY